MRRKEDPTRWSALFGDLEGHLEALAGADELTEIAERTRIEVGRLALSDRLRPAVGQVLDVRCRGAGELRGRLDRVGVDWLLLSEPSGAAALVPSASIVAVSGLSRWSATADGEVDRRLGLKSVLRELVRDRATVRVVLVDGGALGGTIDRVGADFLEIAHHAVDELRRAGSVRRVWTVPLAGLAVVRRTAR
jgi:hypothetical protein